MRRYWWTSQRARTLRKAVAALLCLAICNAFVGEVQWAHAANAATAHSHSAHHHDAIGAPAVAHLDCHGHMPAASDPADHDHNGQAPHAPCDHAHCCAAFVLPAMISTSKLVLTASFMRPMNEHATGLPSASFDRPPIAIL